MSFILRSARPEDLIQMVDLAKQFNLLNLPGDRKILSEKIERSVASFSGDLPKSKAEYLFVVEDLEENLIVGSSLILPKHGTDEVPHTFFKVLKRNHYSEDLGIGFIHQVLRFQMDTDGPTEIGGLLVDKSYRRRPEKLGRQISFVRFNYIGMYPERFEDRLLCELTPPLTDEGRSEFWEALGRRFTGLPYQEADLLSQSHKEFIRSLFPEEDIYLCLLDTKARTVVGRVGESTKPAQYLLESIGFHYLEEVDPFDGGPHYGAKVQDLLPIKHGLNLRVAEWKDSNFKQVGLIGVDREGYRSVQTPYEVRGDEVALPALTKKLLDIDNDEMVYVTPSKF
jgi:arginine N-succinyltransferase